MDKTMTMKGLPKAKGRVEDAVLTIEGSPYTIRAYIKDGKESGVTRTIRVRKDDGVRAGTIYHCVRLGNGEIRCSCPDFFFRNRVCKHLQHVDKWLSS